RWWPRAARGSGVRESRATKHEFSMRFQRADAPAFPDDKTRRHRLVAGRVNQQQDLRWGGEVGGHQVGICYSSGGIFARIAAPEADHRIASPRLVPAEAFLDRLTVVGGEQIRGSERMFAWQGFEFVHLNDSLPPIAPYGTQQQPTNFRGACLAWLNTAVER